MQAALTLKSTNRKTGPIPVSVTADATCPDACPLKESGACYACGGPLAIHWRKVSAGLRGTDWQAFCRQVAALPAGTFWRHNAAGDLPGQADAIDREALRALTAANAGRQGFTYSHKPIDKGPHASANADAIREANAAGFTVNVSVDSLQDVDRIAALQAGPIACLIPSRYASPDSPASFRTQGGLRVVVCPAARRDDIDCKACKACQNARRSFAIGLPAHGASVRKADAIAAGPAKESDRVRSGR
jgi:hypothetical protein